MALYSNSALISSFTLSISTYGTVVIYILRGIGGGPDLNKQSPTCGVVQGNEWAYLGFGVVFIQTALVDLHEGRGGTEILFEFVHDAIQSIPVRRHKSIWLRQKIPFFLNTTSYCQTDCPFRHVIYLNDGLNTEFGTRDFLECFVVFHSSHVLQTLGRSHDLSHHFSPHQTAKKTNSNLIDFFV